MRPQQCSQPDRREMQDGEWLFFSIFSYYYWKWRREEVYRYLYSSPECFFFFLYHWCVLIRRKMDADKFAGNQRWRFVDAGIFFSLWFHFNRRALPVTMSIREFYNIFDKSLSENNILLRWLRGLSRENFFKVFNLLVCRTLLSFFFLHRSCWRINCGDLLAFEGKY